MRLGMRRWHDLLRKIDGWSVDDFKATLSRAKLHIESYGRPVDCVVLGTTTFARLVRHEAQRADQGQGPEFLNATSRQLWGMRLLVDPTRPPTACVLFTADPVATLEGHYQVIS
jgi:hypothetical protein